MEINKTSLCLKLSRQGQQAGRKNTPMPFSFRQERLVPEYNKLSFLGPSP